MRTILDWFVGEILSLKKVEPEITIIFKNKDGQILIEND